MPTHKQSLHLLSLNQLSELTGVGYRTLKKKLASIDPEDEDGRTLLYKSTTALEAIYYGTDEERAEDDTDDQGRKKIDMAYETARNMQLKNEKLEHEIKVARGEFVSKLDNETWMTNKMLGFRTKLRNIAATLSEQLVGLEQKAIESILRQAHDEALIEMAVEDDGESVEGVEEEGSSETSPAAETDDLSMG